MVMLRMLKFVTIIFILTQPLISSAEPNGYPIEPSIDRAGGDYKNFDLPSDARAQDCQSRCYKEDRCQAYTYVKPGIQNPTAPRCWLKESVPTTTLNDCCTSGLKVLDSSLVHTDLEANHHMWTQAHLDMATGTLTANTRTATFTLFGGYRGAVQIALVDSTGFVYTISHVERFGVDGKWIGTNDRTEVWTHQFSPEELKNVRYMQIFHFWCDNPSENLSRWLSGGKQVAELIGTFLSSLGKSGGTGK